MYKDQRDIQRKYVFFTMLMRPAMLLKRAGFLVLAGQVFIAGVSCTINTVKKA